MKNVIKTLKEFVTELCLRVICGISYIIGYAIGIVQGFIEGCKIIISQCKKSVD